jgi:hypothetical protein
MTDNLGPGVSRILASEGTQYIETIWQQGKPPTDADLNLIQQLSLEGQRNSILRGMPSGFLGNETNLQAAFVTDPKWSNYFKFGSQRVGEKAPVVWANVNGYLIPVSGTLTRTGSGSPGTPNDTDISNFITLDPPPAASGNSRTDFVFLEVWKARIQSNPSSSNKPSASGVWKYGNVESGGTPIADDIIDPAFGFETNQRVQIQYRIRVVSGLIGLSGSPDGFDATVVKAQGAAASATSFVFENMRVKLGDPGLWRAGDGNQNALGTVDGYVYAIPIAVVFRRNSIEWSGNPSQNLNGGFNRNPSADRTGVKIFSTVPTLAANISAIATSLTLASAANIPMPTSVNPVLIQIGDELMTYTSIVGASVTIGARGVNGTRAEAHSAGAVIKVASTRPDGLYADQITAADILDLRHVVNPNGFDYNALLKGSLDKLLRGRLRANWKRSGQQSAGAGAVVHYQDVISNVSPALGTAKLDGPDGIRMIFSDAASVQPIECIVSPSITGTYPYTGVGISLTSTITWSLQIQAVTTQQNTNGVFTSGDKIMLPISQLQQGLEADQVRWLNDGVLGEVKLRIEGETNNLPSTMFSVSTDGSGNLVITVGSSFPSISSTTFLHVTAYAVYGAGRGLSLRPDALHSVSYTNPSIELAVQQSGTPSSNKGSRVSWAPLWGKYRGTPLNGLLPVTAEAFSDLGSKTIIMSPFRRVTLPNLVTIDGNAANPDTTAKFSSSTGEANDTSTFTDAGTVQTAAVGDSLVITSGVGAGRYTILAASGNNYTLDRAVRGIATGITYSVSAAQGVMPTRSLSTSAGTKWGGNPTDPLNLFCGSSMSTAAQKNIYVTVPRHLMPGWGELRLPILVDDSTLFSRGPNFGVLSKAGSSHTSADANYVNYNPSPTRTYALFATDSATTSGPLTYTTITYNTVSSDGAAGIRQFTDTRGLGRQGLELPPFYGVARLLGVYEAGEYARTAGGGSGVNPSTRDVNGAGATNLLRQNMTSSEGPLMWIEIDSDGDSTFVLNAEAIDISRSTVNPIASFAAGKYVVEASIFGFDRGTFDLSKEARLVMTRPTGGSDSWATLANNTPVSGVRANNINKAVAGPVLVVPGPLTASDQVVVNYSRTVYQGDAWGSQSSNMDLPQRVGPLLSADAANLSNLKLNQGSLTRPNQKVLEVLAATSFSTTLGTGRYSADASTNPLTLVDVGYEDHTNYPPTNTVAPRPITKAGNFVTADLSSIGSEYLGCTERLPMGALFRDKDFRGQAFGASPLVVSDTCGAGAVTRLAIGHEEAEEAPVGSMSSGIGSPGDVIVLVDGEQINLTSLINYRVNRGGSVFVAGGAHPGGAVSLQNQAVVAQTDHVNVLQGRALLVRNTVTNVGSNEVSAGDELMLLVLTTAQQHLPVGVPAAGQLTIGTAGEGEGYSAADLYRIEGHPLVKDNVNLQIDPSTIKITR